MMHKRKPAGKGRVYFSSRSRKIAVAAGVLFIAVNFGTAILYHGRVLPNTRLGRLDIGGKSLSSLNSSLSRDVLPATLTLQTSSASVRQTPAQLGISVDITATLHKLKTSHSVLPVLDLFRSHYAAMVLHVDNTQFSKTAGQLAASFNYSAQPAHIVFNGTTFATAAAHGGYKLDSSKLLAAVTSAIQQAKTKLTVPTMATPPPAGKADLTAVLQQLQRELRLKFSFASGGRSVQPSASDIGHWFAPSGQTMTPSAAAITAYVNSVGRRFGSTVANPDDVATAVIYGLNKNESLNLAVVPETSATVYRTYCTAVDGVSSSVLTDLTGKLAAVYNDTRGWNDGGRIAFEHASSGCQYTVWMAASSQMTSFGAICDDYYNCQVGTNVILNYDRWVNTTTPWLAKTNGSAEDYRVLMINHETGHRLGFLDNPTCPGTGQRAPVMMQQSIDLKGCVYNIWPLASEFVHLNQMLGAGQTSSVTNLQ